MSKRRRLSSILRSMIVPRLQEETLDLKWFKSNLSVSNSENLLLGEAMGIAKELLHNCKLRGKMMDADKIFNMEIDEALDYKWKMGISEYRGGDTDAEFVGDAVVEMFGELVDAILYNKEAKIKGFELANQFDEILRNLAKLLKQYKKEEESSTTP